VYEQHLLTVTFYNRDTGEEFHADTWLITQYLLGIYPVLAGVWMIAVIMALAVGVFLLYHLHLLYRGTTTNETYKWGMILY
jgi:fatty acid desaturase